MPHKSRFYSALWRQTATDFYTLEAFLRDGSPLLLVQSYVISLSLSSFLHFLLGGTQSSILFGSLPSIILSLWLNLTTCHSFYLSILPVFDLTNVDFGFGSVQRTGRLKWLVLWKQQTIFTYPYGIILKIVHVLQVSDMNFWCRHWYVRYIM